MNGTEEKAESDVNESWEWFKKSMEQPITIRFLPADPHYARTRVHKLTPMMVCPICEHEAKPKPKFRSIDDAWEPS